MTDLNEWRLTYPGTTFNFGTLATDYPFSAQFEISDTEVETQDTPHPTSDGVVFGRDFLRGNTLTFNLTTIPDFPLPAKPWLEALDLASAFRAKWRADAIRTKPGVYATLQNLDRGRLVYGRPRRIGQASERLRQGLLRMVATFDTISPDFYGTTEFDTLITPVPEVVGGFTTPFTTPIQTSWAGTLTEEPIDSQGDVAAWPIIEFHGPGSDWALDLFTGLNVAWSLQITGSLKADEVCTIDTRPWSRGATINGKPANGRLRGVQLEKAVLAPGGHDVRLRVNDPTGTATAHVKWRNAYASM